MASHQFTKTHNLPSSKQLLLSYNNNTGTHTRQKRPSPPLPPQLLIPIPTPTSCSNTTSISTSINYSTPTPTYKNTLLSQNYTPPYCPICLHSLQSSNPFLFPYTTITTSPSHTPSLSTDHYNDKEYPPLGTSLSSTPTETLKYLKSDTTHINHEDSNASAVQLHNNLWLQFNTTMHTVYYSPTPTIKSSTYPSTSISYNTKQKYISSTSPLPLSNTSESNSISFKSSSSSSSSSISSSSPSPSTDTLSPSSTSHTPTSTSPSQMISPNNSHVTKTQQLDISNSQLNNTQPENNSDAQSTDTPETDTMDLTTTNTNTRLLSFIENVKFYLSNVDEYPELFDGRPPGIFLSPDDKTDQHIHQLSIFSKIATEITNTLSESRIKLKSEHVRSLYESMKLINSEFQDYFSKLYDNDPNKPILHSSHYNYPSTHFQNLFDIFFQPDVIAIVQKYYLQNKCPDFKCSDLSFTTKTLDFTVLSKQLLPYLSNDTLEPILNTLFCYSYLSFICSKPFTLEYQPLHTYCTQNPLLSFQCILEFSNTEQIRHDPETPPEEITPLAEKITSIHHKLIYDI